MKYCDKCGNELFDNAVMCPKCGCLCEDKPATPNVNPNYAPSAPVATNRSNGMAIAGFVCSFLSPILGWIFGGIGLGRANKMGGKGKGLALAAIIIASVNFVFSLILQSQGYGIF